MPPLELVRYSALFGSDRRHPASHFPSRPWLAGSSHSSLRALMHLLGAPPLTPLRACPSLLHGAFRSPQSAESEQCLRALPCPAHRQLCVARFQAPSALALTRDPRGRVPGVPIQGSTRSLSSSTEDDSDLAQAHLYTSAAVQQTRSLQQSRLCKSPRRALALAQLHPISCGFLPARASMLPCCYLCRAPVLTWPAPWLAAQV
mmetsp:Transcript_68426/g.118913  ORF Transcript_68426/g.118913 Transcript_68426/m.118913 type:complete len:203 (+) Transcript_68426:423-1031(+)